MPPPTNRSQNQRSGTTVFARAERSESSRLIGWREVGDAAVVIQRRRRTTPLRQPQERQLRHRILLRTGCRRELLTPSAKAVRSCKKMSAVFSAKYARKF